MSHLARRQYCPRLIAHRGGGRDAPENTIAAFETGHKYNYKMFECDVKLSADGVPYLLHDSTLNRTTSATTDFEAQSIACADQTWQDLSQLDAGSWYGDNEKFVGEKIPSLEEVAKWCIENDVDVNLEIKPVPGAERETGKVVAQHADHLWKHSSRKPLLTSFSFEAIEEAKLVAPGIERGVLFETFPKGKNTVTATKNCFDYFTTG